VKRFAGCMWDRRRRRRGGGGGGVQRHHVAHELGAEAAGENGGKLGHDEVEEEAGEFVVGVDVALVYERVPQDHELLLFVADLRDGFQLGFGL
jgi:hypothetical protein